MRLIILAPILLSACTVAPLKEAVEGAVHRRVEGRIEARDESGSAQMCTCQTQYESPTHGLAKLDCSIAEIPTE